MVDARKSSGGSGGKHALLRSGIQKKIHLVARAIDLSFQDDHFVHLIKRRGHLMLEPQSFFFEILQGSDFAKQLEFLTGFKRNQDAVNEKRMDPAIPSKPSA